MVISELPLRDKYYTFSVDHSLRLQTPLIALLVLSFSSECVVLNLKRGTSFCEIWQDKAQHLSGQTRGPYTLTQIEIITTRFDFENERLKVVGNEKVDAFAGHWSMHSYAFK